MIVKVKVKTGALKQKVEVKDGFYLVELKSLPIDGKANQELLKLLKNYFKSKSIKIKSGLISKIKLIEVE